MENQVTREYTLTLEQYTEVVTTIYRGCMSNPDLEGWDVPLEANRILNLINLPVVHTGEEDYVPVVWDITPKRNRIE